MCRATNVASGANGDAMLTKEMRGDAFWRLLPMEIRNSFDKSQETAIRAAAIKYGPGAHAVDYRLSISLPFLGKVYLVLLAGRERRNPTRLSLEAALRPTNRFTRGVLTGSLAISVSMAVLAGMLLYSVLR